MGSSKDSDGQEMTPSRAAKRFGISVKALRLYEQVGLIKPRRTPAGWRVYGADELARIQDIVVLRRMGLGLAEIRKAVGREGQDLDALLASYQGAMEARIGDLSRGLARLKTLRSSLSRGDAATLAMADRVARPELFGCFELPWPWAGERFEIADIRALNFIIGPLGSGKTRFAKCLANALPGAVFLGLERADRDCAAVSRCIRSDLARRVERSVRQVEMLGGRRSAALTALFVGLDDDESSAIVVDMIEHGLDEATQSAVMAVLRGRKGRRKPMFLMTRSTAIFDIARAGDDESILFCPANHGIPQRVVPCAGAPGAEAVMSCLAAPDVRARTEGMMALCQR